MNENDILKIRVDDVRIIMELYDRLALRANSTFQLTGKLTTLNTQLLEANQRVKTIEREKDQQAVQVRTLTNKCTRAEKVAAHLEKQFKESRPNAKIDYQMLTEAEPSTQLLAALMPRVRRSIDVCSSGSDD